VNPYEYPQRDYEPIQPKSGFRELLKKIWAPIVAALALLAKLGSLAKFGTVFIAFGGYALIWGWKFALGVIVLIFLHEMGHFLEAWRERLHPSWPVFIPFLGAYVRYTGGNAWQTARVAVAGPILGGVAALGFYAVGRAIGSQLFEALAYFGFFLNLLNLLPLGILDGGAIWRATRYLWRGGAPGQAIVSGTVYALTAVALAIGAYAAYLPQTRL
jgi:membrane-associated protease RseP (regulator of RpoE activity)